MSLNLFFTLQTLPGAGGQVNAPAQGALSLNPQGQTKGLPQGQSFIDLILKRLAENGQETGTNSKQHDPLASGNPALNKNPKPDIIQILAATPAIAEQVQSDAGDFDLDLSTRIAEVLTLNRNVLDESLKPSGPQGLVSAKVTPENLPQIRNILEGLLVEDQGIQQGTPARGALENILSTLERLVKSDSPAAIVMNLTPEQITQIRDKIAAPGTADTTADTAGPGLASIEPESGEQSVTKDIKEQARPEIDTLPAVFFVSLVTPQPEAKPPQQTASSGAPAQNNATTPAPAAQLNALLVGQGQRQGGHGIPLPFTAGDEFSAGEFKNLIREYTGNKVKTDHAPPAPGNQGKAPAPTASPDLNVLQNWPFAGGDLSIRSGSGLGEYTPEGISTASLTAGTVNSAGLITQSQSAAQPHPATQMIAAQLQKNASNGESRHFTLQLEPPDLGRVEVRMDFGRDKSLKTHMIIEKPETFVMLQRDGHALERALQELGLDGESALSFELAPEEHEFGQNGGRDSRSGGGGKAGEDDGETEIIETVMRWYVDPETGLTRYDFTV